MRWQPGWRRTATGWVAAGGLASAALIWGAIAVFACTNIMGTLSINPGSGPAGTKVTTSASGLVPNASYQIHFGKTPSDSCMSFKNVVTLATVTADASGAWNNVTAKIPSTASMGVHSTCGMETKPVKGGSGTVHDSFAVT